MHDRSDDWIEDRILRNLGKRNLPDGQTVLGPDALSPTHLKTCTSANLSSVGRPVVEFVGGDQFWTLLGTMTLHCEYLSQVVHLNLDDILKISLIGNTLVPRQPCEFICIVDRSGSKHTIWGPPGEGCLALFGVLQMLLRMRKGKGPA